MQIKKKVKKSEAQLPQLTAGDEGELKKRKTRTEVREKPKKAKKGEEVDPLVLKKRMRQLYKAVSTYQVSQVC